MNPLRPAWTLCIALLSAVFSACTTSFDVASLPSRFTATDASADRPDVTFPDVPPMDVPCGAAFGPCCAQGPDAGARACSLESRAVCSQGVCVDATGIN